jgi:hypothetical protein
MPKILTGPSELQKMYFFIDRYFLKHNFVEPKKLMFILLHEFRCATKKNVNDYLDLMESIGKIEWINDHQGLKRVRRHLSDKQIEYYRSWGARSSKNKKSKGGIEDGTEQDTGISDSDAEGV